MTTPDAAKLQKLMGEYLRVGGIPDPLKYPKLPLLRTLYDDVLYRDVATRYRIQEVSALRELAFYLMSNITSSISFNKLKDQLRLGSVNTIKNYIEYLENSWLIFTLNVFDFSLKRQQIAAKKVFCIDNGLANTVGFRFSSNTGKLMENAVFLALRRKTNHIFYYRSKSDSEVDFYLPETGQLIQVAQNLEHFSTREREIRALVKASKRLKISEGLIISETHSDPISMNGMKISIRSAAEWLLKDN